MNKRYLFVALLLVGIIAILGILWWLFGPFLSRTSAPAAQPPALPAKVQPSTGKGSAPPITKTIVKPTAEQQSELQREDVATQQAKKFATALGTYSSSEGFSSFHDMRVFATQDMQSFLISEQARLVAAHPAYGPSWSQSTRALSATITSSLPLGTANTVEVNVQTQQVITTGASDQQVSYQMATIQMTKQGTDWFLSHITWASFTP